MNESTVEKSTSTKNGIKRLVFAGLAVLLQLIIMVSLVTWLNDYAAWINFATGIIAAILVLVIYGQNKTSAMKMPWIIVILVTPYFGVLLYVLVGLDGATAKMRKRFAEVDGELFPLLSDDAEAKECLAKTNPRAAGIATYLKKFANYPVYEC